jgi:hypothetical protein
MTGKFGLIGLIFLTIFIFGNFYLQLMGGPRTQHHAARTIRRH